MHKMLSDALENIDHFPTGITLMGRTLAVDWKQHEEWMAQVSMAVGALRIKVAALESQTAAQPEETTECAIWELAHNYETSTPTPESESTPVCEHRWQFNHWLSDAYALPLLGLHTCQNDGCRALNIGGEVYLPQTPAPERT